MKKHIQWDLSWGPSQYHSRFLAVPNIFYSKALHPVLLTQPPQFPDSNCQIVGSHCKLNPAKMITIVLNTFTIGTEVIAYQAKTTGLHAQPTGNCKSITKKHCEESWHPVIQQGTMPISHILHLYFHAIS